MSNEDEPGLLKFVSKSKLSSGRRQQLSLPHPEDLQKLKSHVRLCVMRILTERLNRPAVYSEADNEIVSALIVEYLKWMGYNRTLETFRLECKLPEEQNICLTNHLVFQQSSLNDNLLPQIFNIMNKYKLDQVTPD